MSWGYHEATEYRKLRHIIRVATTQNELHDSAIHTHVNFTWKLKRPLFDWLVATIPQGEWFYDTLIPTEFAFATKQQAMLFKLTWGNVNKE